ncbi:hypothetical protein LCGC14_3109390, partial [marine sediment metagenome]
MTNKKTSEKNSSKKEEQLKT